MKRLLPFLIGFIILALVAILVARNDGSQVKKINEHITLKRKDKIPYGTSAAKTVLPELFPNASISYDNKAPGEWDSIFNSSADQAVILLATDFNADDNELERLLFFAREGNDVFIIARNFSYDASRFFNFMYNAHAFDTFFGATDDSLSVKLGQPSPIAGRLFIYPGKKYESSFNGIDSAHTTILGTDENNEPNFIRLKADKGNIFIHSAPLAFSNYFILHKNNMVYFQNAFSVMPPSIRKIVWNEYYLNKPTRNKEEEPSWFRVLLSYPAFKWGLITGLLMLALYMLLESRRKQKKIPKYEKPKNDSLDFVKTIGRLYYDRRDHQNLCKKMAVYFLDHVRTVYKLPTDILGEQFILALHQKSAYPLEEITEIVSFITYLGNDGPVNEKQLYQFHRQLESFYQKT